MAVSAFSFPTVPTDLLSFWQALHKKPRHGFFLGSGAGSLSDHLVYMSAGEPITVIRAGEGGDGRADFVPGWRKSLRPPSRRPLRGDAPRFVGYFGFEAGRLFDEGIGRLPSQKNILGTPVVELGDYPCVVKVDLLKKETTVFFSSGVTAAEKKRIIELVSSLEFKKQTRSLKSQTLNSKHNFSHIPFHKFSSMVKKAKQSIAAGDIYQANLSFRFQRDFHGDPVQLYRVLCQTNPSPYACLIKSPDSWLVSSSPELLLSVEGKKIKTRPIAGTRPRGSSKERDRHLKGQLLLSPKERAEHIMLVDLERNDLGRVCVPGSVRVSESYGVEKYSHVMHIVSQVEGKLKKDQDALGALKAVFPGGTISGCPKIKSIQIIEDLEAVSRGPFYGSAGYFSWNGNATFNILIRTALIKNKKIYVQAGAGIVADSNPKREYREVLAKAQVLLEAVGSLKEKK